MTNVTLKHHQWRKSRTNMLKHSMKSWPSTTRNLCELCSMKLFQILIMYNKKSTRMWILSWSVISWQHYSHFVQKLRFHTNCTILKLRLFDIAEQSSLEMKRCVVEVLQADHGHKQVDDGGNEVDQHRKTRQRDHQCHCGKNFQVGEMCPTFLPN